MKAILVGQFGAPEVLLLSEVPDPIAGPGEIVVRLHAIGINPVDTYIRAGTYPRTPALPYTPGMDGAGVIESLGAGVKDLSIGQRVYLTGSLAGTYAEKTLCTPSQVEPLPDNVSFEQGAALGVPYATAQFALFERAAARPGDTVLIHGASGGVGLAAVQLARAAGMRVFGTAGTPEGLHLVRSQGAHEVFDHSAPDYTDAILQKSGGGVDVILEMLANVNLARDLTLLKTAGRVAIIGSRGPIEINPRDLMARSADVRGVILFAATPEQHRRIHAALRAGLESGTLRPVIAHRFALADAPKAHIAQMTSGAQGKIVLTA